MKPFADWCQEEDKDVGENRVRLVTVPEANYDGACDLAASAVPDHYVSPTRLADVFKKLGKPAVAKLLAERLPTAKTTRSGDLGEIIATEYIDDRTDYTTPVKRLRWKDHREMSMRGDDVIAIRPPGDHRRIRFLKVESKSQAALKTATVDKARQALDGDAGLPSSHALTFVAERLIELGQVELADAIDKALLSDGISSAQVQHMLFVFCGNDPHAFLKADLEAYDGSIGQFSVGFRIAKHQDFIASVYDKVLGGDES